MKRLMRSFSFAFKGLQYAAATQPNFRIHLALAAVAVVLGFLLQISSADWHWIMLAITFVLVVELLNTGIEALTDLASPGYHELAGRAKDVCAGAVVIAALFALITGIMVFLPKLILLARHVA